MDSALRIKASLGEWDDADDKILRSDEITTPTDAEPFFDEALDGVFLRADELAALLAKYGGGDEPSGGPVEPAREPCTDEIPWNDLVYWLGNAATGQVECPCAKCHHARRQGEAPGGHHVHGADGLHVYIPTSFYKRLRAKIPVIAIPRIEGIN